MPRGRGGARDEDALSPELISSLSEISGADWKACREALQRCNGDANEAAEMLLMQQFEVHETAQPPPQPARDPAPPSHPQQQQQQRPPPQQQQQRPPPQQAQQMQALEAQLQQQLHVWQGGDSREPAPPATSDAQKEPICFPFLNKGVCKLGASCRFRHLTQDHPDAIADRIRTGHTH
eukprot:4287818-Prymnesium_polylepis.1